MSASENPLQGLTVLERGWLSSNNILIHAAPGEPGAVLIDSGHVNHADQTVALLHHALAGEPLARLVNTHLHADHCGGNAALQRAFGMPVTIPPGQADAVRHWDIVRLGFHDMDQRHERFTFDDTLAPGEVLRAGGRRWQVLAARGHDPHSVMFFDAEHGVLISADALWENGFGVVFPEVFGEAAFGDVGAVLDLIETLPVRVVIPGHGAPFTDVAGALLRARQRLAAFVSQPERHLRHAAKVAIKFHVMEEREVSLQALIAWAAATSLMCRALSAASAGDPPSSGQATGLDGLVRELVHAGALLLKEDTLRDP